MLDATNADDSIEDRASMGGAFLIIRQLIGLGLSVITVVAITRMLGPLNYGVFAIANGLAVYISDVGRLGLDVYLIRYPGHLDEHRLRVTQTLYVLIALGAALGLLLLAPALAHWYNEPRLLRVFQAYALVVPILLFAAIPTALLDRELNFRRIATVELAGQVTNIVISLPLIWLYHSMWGLVAGILGQALVVLCATWWSVRLRIGWQWDREEAVRQLRYGAGYAMSIWIWQARTLVNPLVVGMLVGSEAVAYVALAIRLTTTLSFATSAVWRVYMSLLARLAHDRSRMKAAIETGMVWQVMLVSVIFVSFTAISREVIVGVMGQRWLPVLQVLPFIAAATIVNSGFSLYSSALYVIEAWKEIVVFHVIHVVLFASAALAVMAVMRNVQGYGWAEIVACASYCSVRASMRRRLFPVREGPLYGVIVLAVALIALLSALSTSSLAIRLTITVCGAAALAVMAPKDRFSVETLKRSRLGRRLRWILDLPIRQPRSRAQ